MARCMLCSSPAGAADVVCPRCGGALEEGPEDVTRVEAVDLGKPGADDGTTGPFAPAPGWVPPTGPPGYDAGPPGYGPPTGPPPGYGPGWAPPGYGPPPGPPPGLFGVPPGPPGGAEAPGPPPGYLPPYPPPPGYGGGVPYAPYGYPGFQPQPLVETLAVGSLITSIVGLATAFFCYVPIFACPVGAVMGHVALRRIEEGHKGGKGLALAGVIVGWIGTGLLVLGLIALLIIVVLAGTTS